MSRSSLGACVCTVSTFHPAVEGGGSFLSRLFDVGEFTARVVCMNRASVIWLHLVSDTIIAAAYFSIPIALLTLALRRRDLAFPGMFVLFGGFILLCGTTHVFNVLALHYPLYRLDGLIKGLTAAFSIGTAVALWPLIPKILTIPNPDMMRAVNAELEGQMAQRGQAQADLQKARDELQQRVYTTKTRAFSTGLGLALVNGVVERGQGLDRD